MNYFTKYLFIYIFILLLCIILIYIRNKLTVEKFEISRKIIYLKKKDGETIFKKSDYIKNLSSKDLEIRNCYSISECINIYSNSIVDFTLNEKTYLEKITSTINNSTKKYMAFNTLSWRFIKLKGNIENRFPFTLENVIFLNESFFAKSRMLEDTLQTIFHEQLHIYQRYNEEKTKLFYKNIGFTLTKCICSDKIEERSNPDIYKNTHYIYNGYIIRNHYTKNANNLSNTNIIFNKIKNSNEYNGEKNLNKLKLQYNINIEHPNEIFATIIPLNILKKIKFDEYFNNLDNEINKYLN